MPEASTVSRREAKPRHRGRSSAEATAARPDTRDDAHAPLTANIASACSLCAASARPLMAALGFECQAHRGVLGGRL